MIQKNIIMVSRNILLSKNVNFLAYNLQTFFKYFLGPLQDQNDSDLREIDPTPPLENQDLRSRMTPDGGNPSEAKNNDDDNDTSSEKC